MEYMRKIADIQPLSVRLKRQCKLTDSKLKL